MGRRRKELNRNKLRILMELRKRQEEDLIYKPNEKQQAFHESQAMVRVLRGPNRSGKSYAMRKEINWTFTGTHPYRGNYEGGRYMLTCLSRDQADMLWKEYLLGKGANKGVLGRGGAIPNWAIRQNSKGTLAIAWETYAGKHIPVKIETKNGKTLHLKWHGDPNLWKRFQGPEFDGFFMDEAGEQTELITAEALMRMATIKTMEMEGKLPKGAGFIVWAASQTTINSVLDDWVEKGYSHDDPMFETFDLEKGHNPAVSKEALELIRHGLSAEQAAIRIDGTESASGHLSIFPRFNPERHIRKTPYEFRDNDVYVAAYDPGKTKDDTGWLIGVLNEDEPRLVRLVAFLTCRRKSVPEEVDLLSHWLRGRRIRWVAYDKYGVHARDKAGKGQNILQMLKEAMRDERFWENGHQRLVKPKGSGRAKDIYIKRVRLYLDPPSDIYHKPLLEIDVPNEENGLGKFVSQMRRYRLKATAAGNEANSQTIYEKNNEGPDCLMQMLHGERLGPHWTEPACVQKIDRPVLRPDSKRDAEELRELSIEEQIKEEKRKRSEAIARRASG